MTRLIAGKRGALTTGTVLQTADKRSATVTIEGPIAALKAALPESFVPAGFTLNTSSLTPNGNGLARLTVNSVKYEGDGSGGSGFSAIRETIRVEPQEAQYDLEDHPHLAPARDIILKWLATDESKRVDGNSYKYMDASGALNPVVDDLALKFCKSYMAGIKTFNRYYPVVEKISIWSNPPGISRFGRSFRSGSPTFSSGLGKYNDPPITLNGFGSGHWFKSKDGWVENENTTWTRTEQWTYTPESSSGDNAWIYTEL